MRFLPATLVTAVIIFAAQSTEYRGLDLNKLTGGLVALSAAGAVSFVLVAFASASSQAVWKLFGS